MHLLVDAFAVQPGSAAITVENLLLGWSQLGTDDRVTVVAAEDKKLVLPEGMESIVMTPPVGGAAGRIWARTLGVRRAARELGADAVLSAVPASGLLGAPTPHGIILYDLRHELRPHQFPLSRRIARRVSWGWNMRQTDGIYCISRRTLSDLERSHARAARKGVVARYGADHVDSWPQVPKGEPPYALAFGHFSNKNVPAVLEGWRQFCETDDKMVLRLVGMGRADRESATARVSELGIAERVQLMPWLDDDEFKACFAGASLVVFPSDFEGFGLPAIEALRLRIPLVVSGDEALAEVTGGHAATARSVGAADLAAAMREAMEFSPEHLEAGRRHTDGFQWRGTAQAVRDGLLSAR
ncbi:glycosyltransferase involved in cell wall biosynthesis [Nocardioides thalensis]|uniref:Glycosyltransferase involved in cell wall biosynthesis n=1 Tax=Nocardioides thalensis TaxID=1914755 RepID=A0A853C449_9ACTN|nr:glycosyltransferase [Nocardioides thalensis]NYJ02890.1 glycosyltransferase involved in cell wall biosynthesis [Nocardioides thalensis]